MQIQIERQKRQIARPPFIAHCPFGDGHEWAVAATFLSEADLFAIGASPGDMVCRKCWGIRKEYEVVEK